MNAGLWVSQLPTLFDGLERAGFTVTVQSRLAVHDLLLRLTVEGSLPGNADALGRMIGPIVCTSPSEQEQFESLFQQWQQQLTDLENSPPKDPPVELEIGKTPAKPSANARPLLTGVVIAAVAALAVWINERRFEESYSTNDFAPMSQLDTNSGQSDSAVNPEEKPQLDSDDESKIQGEQPPEPESPASQDSALLKETTEDLAAENSGGPELITETHTTESKPRFGLAAAVTGIGLLVSVLAVCTCWWLSAHWRKRFLVKRSVSHDPEMKHLAVHCESKGTLGNSFWRTAQRFRQHVSRSSHRLDVSRTAARTAANGGLFTPVRAEEKVSPSYLMLIESDSRRDQQTQMIDSLVDQLESEGVAVTRYYFRGDPRICRQPGGRAKRLTELAAGHHSDRLMVFADARSFLDPMTGAVSPWIEAFESWSERALMVAAESENWSSAEATMSEHFRLAPANSRGLASLVEQFTPDPNLTRQIGNDRYPAMLREHPERWLDREAPSQESLDKLLDQLREYLGEAGYQWLSVCAVYPTLHTRLTLWTGESLVDKNNLPLVNDSDLMRLSRLPWLRHGQLPDWLRARLIADLSERQELAIRNRLDQLFRSALNNSETDASLPIARDARISRSDHHKRGRILRDHTFLSFMSNPLSVRLPRAIGQMLPFHRNGRPWRAVAAVAIVATLFAASALLLAPAGQATTSTVHSGSPAIEPQETNEGEDNFVDSRSNPGDSLSETERKAKKSDKSDIYWTDPHCSSTLRGHTICVLSVAFSPDGTRIVSGSGDDTVKVWDAESGEETLTLRGHTEAVTSVSFSPDGTRIVSGSGDDTVKVWDVESGEETLTLRGHTNWVTSVSFSPDGTRIVSGSGDKTVKVWEAESGDETLTLRGHTYDVSSVSFSPDGTRIVSGSRDNTVKVWGAESGEETLTLRGHTASVSSVSFSPDGTRIVSGSRDHTVTVWDAESGEETVTLKGHGNDVYSVAFSPDGRRIASGSVDDTIKVWDVSSGQETLTLRGHGGAVYSVAFSQNGQSLVSGSADETLKVWPVGRLIREQKANDDNLKLSIRARTTNSPIVVGDEVTITVDLLNEGQVEIPATTVIDARYVGPFEPEGFLDTLRKPVPPGASKALELPGIAVQKNCEFAVEVKLWADSGREQLLAENEVKAIAHKPLSVPIPTVFDQPEKAAHIKVTGPSEAIVGEQMRFKIVVTNAGAQPLKNVAIRNKFDQGLKHVGSGEFQYEQWQTENYSPAERAKINAALDRPVDAPLVSDLAGHHPIKKNIGELAPGDSRFVSVQFRASGPGKFGQTIQVLDGNQVIAATEHYLSTPGAVPQQAVAPNVKPDHVTNSIGMKLRLIPAGEFQMGSSKSAEEIARRFDRDAEFYEDEHPQHPVRITKPFYLATTEVTQGQWQAVMGTRPWAGQDYVKEGKDYPATYVSWEDAVEFCRRLSAKEGKTYRLPTEAEWEYACRAGSRTIYSFGDDASRLGDYAWFHENAWDVDERYAHRVAVKRPNAWGLYDMHGNVWEWCSDRFATDYYEGSPALDPSGPASGSSRVYRGGGWYFRPLDCRSANRGRYSPDYRYSFLGFRVARSSVSK